MQNADIEYSNPDATRWRFLIDDAASGAWNMAVDEALLRAMGESADENLGAPILRFYAWNPSCLSIGRFQKTAKLDLENVDYVRRPTGGRAVWHDLEVTYSVILRETHLPRDAHSVVDSYRFISEGFLRGLKTLGVRAEIARGASASATSSTRSPQNAESRNSETRNSESQSAETQSAEAQNAEARDMEQREVTPNCFESQTRADFVVDGRKLLGAAQCRQNGAILQHGSLLLDLNRVAWQQKIGGDLSRIVTLRDLGIDISRDELQNILARALAEMFGALLEKSVLTARETQVAKALLHKYDSALWNESGREETAEKPRESVL